MKQCKHNMFNSKIPSLNFPVQANFARWEPPHGSFSYQHPWKQYLKVGTAMRSCAYCLEALNSCINNKNQVKF